MLTFTGYVMGQKLSLIDYAYMASETAMTGTDLLAFYVVQAGLVLLSLFLFLHWLRAGASTWLEVTIARQSPNIAYWSGLCLASILLVIWLGFLSYVVDDIRGTGIRILQEADISAALKKAIGISVSIKLSNSLAFTIALIIGILEHPLTLIMLISLWAYPFTAWFWRDRYNMQYISNWAFLDSSVAQRKIIFQSPLLKPKLAIRVGVFSGILFWGLAFILSKTFAEVSSSTRYDFYLYGLPFVATFVQTVTACGVALKIRRLPVLHSLFAAFVGACVMSVGAFFASTFCEGDALLRKSGELQNTSVISTFYEGISVIPPEMYWITSSQIFNSGALLAMLATLVSTATMRLLTNSKRVTR